MSCTKALLMACSLMCCAPLAAADDTRTEPTLDDVRRSFAEVDRNRIDHVSRELVLPLPVARKFWPAYNAYLRNRIALRDKQLAALVDYADALNSGTLDDATATRLLNDGMADETVRIGNRQQFIRSLGEFLAPQQQMRLYQIEVLLDAQVRAGLLQQIPLAE
ncbi:hypothetical protein BSY238_1385 [Methyloversatilis sp. RAC08]|nr:hypothetical protein BSY238_1385 [Methyloversatilis sp. RAC08]